MTTLSLSIPGAPRGKDRPRASARIIWEGGKPRAIITMNTSKETVAAEKAIGAEFRRRFPRHRPFTGPVMVRITAVFPIPDGFTVAQKKAARAGVLLHTTKPDLDNIIKAALDSLNELAWVDDSQCMGGGMKRYGECPRLDITIEPLDQPDVPKSPHQIRREAALAIPEPERVAAALRRPTPRQAPKKAPTALQRAIDAAIARDAGK